MGSLIATRKWAMERSVMPGSKTGKAINSTIGRLGDPLLSELSARGEVHE